MATTMEQAFVDAGFKPLKQKKVRPAKPQKCRKCGGETMVNIPGTNVVACTNDIESKNEAGETISRPCGNRFTFKREAA